MENNDSCDKDEICSSWLATVWSMGIGWQKILRSGEGPTGASLSKKCNFIK